jgi:hypothetical protein
VQASINVEYFRLLETLPSTFSNIGAWRKAFIPLLIEELKTSVSSTLQDYSNPVFGGFRRFRNHSIVSIRVKIQDPARDAELLAPGSLVLISPNPVFHLAVRNCSHFTFGIAGNNHRGWDSMETTRRFFLDFNVPEAAATKFETNEELYIFPLENLITPRRILGGLQDPKYLASESLIKTMLTPSQGDLTTYAGEMDCLNSKTSDSYEDMLLNGLSLNSSQLNAMRNIFHGDKQEVFLLDGPPGTGTKFRS